MLYLILAVLAVGVLGVVLWSRRRVDTPEQPPAVRGRIHPPKNGEGPGHIRASAEPHAQISIKVTRQDGSVEQYKG